MIKLFSLKQQKKEEESAGGTKGSSKKASAAQLRIQKDINELNLPKTCDISFSDPDDLLNFKLVICPDEGFYKSGKFVFSFKVGQGYPHDPPKVKCETMVYHPNIDLEGNVCLNILREDWKPVLTINSIIYGLQYLFLIIFSGNGDDGRKNRGAVVGGRAWNPSEESVTRKRKRIPVPGPLGFTLGTGPLVGSCYHGPVVWAPEDTRGTAEAEPAGPEPCHARVGP
uniref:Ubiquitin conjugating enzyme E2 M n=1 Tax=Felis catus TaxID=9685 RepID=A0ABI8APF2_FELCA